MKKNQFTLFSRFTLVAITLLGAQSAVRAAIIYYDDFTNAGAATDLNDWEPTATGIAGGENTLGLNWTSSSGLWTVASGGSQVTNGGSGETAYLPFIPQNGLIYSLEASFVHTVSTTSGFNLGFSLDAPGSIDTATTMFEDTPGGSYAWGYVRGGLPNTTDNYAGTVPLDGTAITSPTTAPSVVGAETVLSIVLDTRQTTTGFWEAEWFMNGDSIGTYSYNLATTSIQNIKSVGFGAAGPVIANVDSFSLSAVPEPTSALAGCLLAAGLLRRKRR